MKKFVAEFIGTMTLVFLGCGTAMLVGCDAANGSGYLLTALAFGLVIVGMAYCVGNISGCHINPAVSFAVFLNDGMELKDMIGYILFQCLGAFAGSALLGMIFHMGDLADMTKAYGANGLAGVNGSIFTGFLVEAILTFIFVLTILGVTEKKANHGSFAGVVIGFTLTLVHILGIGLTGTSVNPARSIGPAIVALIMGNSTPFSEVGIFIIGPFIGAAVAAFVWKYLKTER